MKNDNNNSIGEKVKSLLASYLGVDTDDISMDDSLVDDLHIHVSDLTDFLEKLANTGFDTDNIDLTEVETVGDLVEALSTK